MDDELLQLEVELKRLVPAAPSRGLTARVAMELDRAPARRTTLAWLCAALPAAAAVAFLLGQFLGRPSTRPVAAPASPSVAASSESRDAVLKPIAAEKVLISADDEGFVILDDGTTARRERLQFVDTITWRNPRTNASLRWTVPREEVRIVPVALQ